MNIHVLNVFLSDVEYEFVEYSVSLGNGYSTHTVNGSSRCIMKHGSCIFAEVDDILSAPYIRSLEVFVMACVMNICCGMNNRINLSDKN